MKLDPRLISVIGRLHPEFYDGPHFGGPVYGPTHAQVGAAAGRQVAHAVLHAVWLGQVLGQEVSWEDGDDICPPYPRGPKVPPGVGPIGPDPENPTYLTAYYLGLASVLADGVERGVTAPFVGGLLEKSVANLERSVSR